MRIAEVCDLCATYIGTKCVLYDGDYLSILDISPLDPLDEIIVSINDTFPALSGAGIPTSIPQFLGQEYIQTTGPVLWIGLSTTVPNWGYIGTITTTTTTTSTTSTTTTAP